MAKLLEVREFQAITCNSDFENDSSMKYLDEKVFDELEKFILEFTEDNNADAIDFFKVGIRRNVGKVIQAKNYVGLIQMKSGSQIQILPKISYISDAESKRVFLKMLRSMKDFPGKIFNDASLNMERMNLYEIFINMYVQEVQHIVKKGIRSAYLVEENNLNYYKGKLKVSENIKQNAAHGEKFYMEYDEFGVNRPENCLIKSTLLKLQCVSSSASNIKYIRQLLVNFEMVKHSINYTKDFSKVVIDRNTKDYESIMRWSKVFLMNQSFTTFSGKSTARALLFPMEKVFEAYVARYLKKMLADCGWEVSTQDKGYYLFDFPEKFALRPDIVITRSDGSKIVLDTKWKSLVNRPDKNYGISQSDMYQMYAYSKKYKTPEIWLLYPMNDEMQGSKQIEFLSKDDEHGNYDVQVKLFFVNVAEIESSIYELRTLLV